MERDEIRTEGEPNERIRNLERYRQLIGISYLEYGVSEEDKMKDPEPEMAELSERLGLPLPTNEDESKQVIEQIIEELNKFER
ncbi:MAG: hypothetical protein Q7S37_00280 [bacterium]|nr:hypothetical protein [bacterium]